MRNRYMLATLDGGNPYVGLCSYSYISRNIIRCLEKKQRRHLNLFTNLKILFYISNISYSSYELHFTRYLCVVVTFFSMSLPKSEKER